MLKPVLLAVSAVLILGFAPASKAKPSNRHPPVGDCHDDDMVDRCSPEKQRQVRELFGVKAIEAHRDAGDQVRRAFYVDGYGHDVVAIVFIRPKGGDPALWVHFPKDGSGKRPEPLQAPVPLRAWEELIERSAHFDQVLATSAPAKRSGGAEQQIIMCLHSWVFTVEATDPAKGEYRPATLRRRTEDACDNGLTEAYAVELQRAAVPLLAPCARLDPRQHRGEAKLLSACRLLRGDRLAAAEVRNALQPFFGVEGPEDVPALRDLFASDGRIDWAGEKPSSPSGAAEFWVKKMTEAGRTDFYYDFVEGESADRVRVVGMLYRSIDGETRDRQAEVEMTWVRDGDAFEVEQAVVRPFVPEPAKAEASD